MRFSDEDIARIHRYEDRIGWVGSAGIFAELNDRYGPFWSRGKMSVECESEIRSFERRIYPIWAAIYAKSNDLQAMHQADLAIRGCGYSVNFGAGQNMSSESVGASY